MYAYIEGIVKYIGSNYIIIDNNGIGYQIYTPNPYSFNLEKKDKIHIYQHIREDENSLYGFKLLEEKEFFLKLIEVKGLGCKMALAILATDSIAHIKEAIENENVLYLKKFPKIGDKVAKQIVLDLKGKLNNCGNIPSTSNNNTRELIEALESLGYKQNDFKKIIPNIDTKLVIEEQIKQALKLLLK